MGQFCTTLSITSEIGVVKSGLENYKKKVLIVNTCKIYNHATLSNKKVE